MEKIEVSSKEYNHIIYRCIVNDANKSNRKFSSYKKIQNIHKKLLKQFFESLTTTLKIYPPNISCDELISIIDIASNNVVGISDDMKDCLRCFFKVFYYEQKEIEFIFVDFEEVFEKTKEITQKINEEYISVWKGA